LVAVAQDATSGRLAHYPQHFTIEPVEMGEAGDGPAGVSPGPGVVEDGDPAGTSSSPPRRPTLALAAEGPRRADLIAWASAHRDELVAMRLLAPAGIGALLSEHVGLATERLKSGTVGPAATAGLAAAGDIDAMIAFSDPIELRPGDTTTRSLTRLAVFWDIPIAGNRATADLLLATVTAGRPRPPVDLATKEAASETARGAVQLWTVRATVDDVPGRLAILAASLARRAINILSVQVHLTPEGPVDELLVAASPVLSTTDLTAAVIDGGARMPRVAPADAHALVDAPTRALNLATRLVRTPEDLPAILTNLLAGAQLSWHAEAPEGHGAPVARDAAPTALWLADPSGGGFLLSRPAAPFTPAECARAYAMMDVATVALARGAVPGPDPDSGRLLLPDGVDLSIRPASPDDLDAVVALHARCSMTSRLRRYLAGTRCPTDSTLARLLSPATGRALLVEDEAGQVIAMGNLVWDGEVPELALLVEDGWQNRRLGTVLARRLVRVAAAEGAPSVRAIVHSSNTPMVRIMSGVGQRLHREYDGGLLTLIAALHREPAQTQRLPSSMRRIQSA
jgi:methylglyoxal synthase/GNAT superfamily N-acetyltransferase